MTSLRGRRAGVRALWLAAALGLVAGCKGGGGGSTGGAGGSASGAGGEGGGGLAGSAGTTGGAGGDPDAAPAFSRPELLAAFGACAAQASAHFRDQAAALETAAATLAAAADDAALVAAREAFGQAMDAWQAMEVMQFGPTAPRTIAGGQGFRDEIYAWPTFGRCAIEEGIIARSYESATTFAAQLVNRRGLGALEYLLFFQGAGSSCSGASLASWNALSVEERAAGKRAYAAAAAHDVAVRAAALAAAWDPAGGNFAQTLRGAGPGNAIYPTLQDAFNSISDAAFYVENQVKDMKLAQPLGMDMTVCDGTICPELLESQFAARNKANVRVDLDGVRRLLEGCGPDHAGLGFDDLLASVGKADVAARLRERAIAAEAAVDAIAEPDLKDALTGNKPAVDALYQAVKAVTDILKTEFVMVLDLRLPADTLGDND